VEALKAEKGFNIKPVSVISEAGDVTGITVYFEVSENGK
jgi:hypothetical protein